MRSKQFIHLVDDDPAVRHSLGLMLITRGYGVQAHEDARHFLESVDDRMTDCVAVVDVRMGSMSGLELLEELRNKSLDLPVIVITAYADVPLVTEAMRLGAVDLVEKPIDDDAFVACIDQALASASVRKFGARSAAEAQEIRTRLATLTARETDVLKGLLRGQFNKGIAHELGLSIKTVEVHRSNVMSKLGARSLPELVRASLLALGMQ